MKRKNLPALSPSTPQNNLSCSDSSEQTKDHPDGSLTQFLQSDLCEISKVKKSSSVCVQQNNQTSFPVYYNLHELMKSGSEFHVLESDDHGWMIASRNGPCFLYHSSIHTALGWLRLHPDCLNLLCIFDEAFMQVIHQQYRLTWKEKCFQFVIPDRKNSEELQNDTDAAEDFDFHLQQAAIDNLPYIRAHYDLEPEEEIVQSIMNDRLFMIIHQKQTAGFIGIHPEGSMGMLFIHPDFRHKKLASKAELALSSVIRKRNLIPVFDVFENNSASLSLQKSLKQPKLNGFVWWLSQKSEERE